jgi:hypothetical protein
LEQLVEFGHEDDFGAAVFLPCRGCAGGVNGYKFAATGSGGKYHSGSKNIQDNCRKVSEQKKTFWNEVQLDCGNLQSIDYDTIFQRGLLKIHLNSKT